MIFISWGPFLSSVWHSGPGQISLSCSVDGVSVLVFLCSSLYRVAHWNLYALNTKLKNMDNPVGLMFFLFSNDFFLSWSTKEDNWAYFFHMLFHTIGLKLFFFFWFIQILSLLKLIQALCDEQTESHFSQKISISNLAFLCKFMRQFAISDFWTNQVGSFQWISWSGHRGEQLSEGEAYQRIIMWI